MHNQLSLPEADKKDLNVEQEVGEAFGHLALQLFISNLRPLLSKEILELKPKSLSEAFQKAKEVEHFKAKENSLAMLKKVRTYLKKYFILFQKYLLLEKTIL